MSVEHSVEYGVLGVDIPVLRSKHRDICHGRAVQNLHKRIKIIVKLVAEVHDSGHFSAHVDRAHGVGKVDHLNPSRSLAGPVHEPSAVLHQRLAAGSDAVDIDDRVDILLAPEVPLADAGDELRRDAQGSQHMPRVARRKGQSNAEHELDDLGALEKAVPVGPAVLPHRAQEGLGLETGALDGPRAQRLVRDLLPDGLVEPVLVLNLAHEMRQTLVDEHEGGLSLGIRKREMLPDVEKGSVDVTIVVELLIHPQRVGRHENGIVVEHQRTRCNVASF